MFHDDYSAKSLSMFDFCLVLKKNLYKYFSVTDTINAADANITAEMINNTVYFYITSCFYYFISLCFSPSFLPCPHGLKLDFDGNK